MNRFRLRQAWLIARIEMRRAFFSRRALWVYLLALLPAFMFLMHGVRMRLQTQRWSGREVTAAALLDSCTEGMKVEEVLARAGNPIEDESYRRPRRVDEERHGDRRVVIDTEHTQQIRILIFFDGRRQVRMNFEDGVLRSKRSGMLLNFEEDRTIFAGIFQYFYLRLAIFFGCLGIFMNLFRGEMLDKTLHYWLLAPARREVLLLGKYLSGLVASTAIFTGGALLAFALMIWPHDPAQVSAYWSGAGLAHMFWYAAAAALGCLGYGSIFLAAGLLLRNPIIPAAIVLAWENINGFLPSLLQKLSVLHYLQSLCPVAAPSDPNAPAVLRLLLAPAAPTSALASVVGLLALTALVLWAAARVVRRVEINYSTE